MSKSKRRTLRERAQGFGEAIYRDKNHPLRFERRNCPGCIADIWLAGYRAGYRAGKREGKAEAMKACGWGEGK